ncbi:MAG TPA: hypothetical protein DHW02_25140, partial [Ktedonobacter sp.]|nr:hypothetical protein [Ktedonobacter sp.]
FDTESKGHTIKGLVVRFGYIVISFFYFSFAYGALRLVVDTQLEEQTTTTTTRDWTALLLNLPLGVAFVILFALIMLGIGVYLLYKAYAAFYKSSLKLDGLNEIERRAVIISGRIGYAALGIVFTIIAFFLIIAAIQHKPGDAVGLDGALRELVSHPFGPFLLDIVAIGFIAYGIFSILEAFYRYVRVAKPESNENEL